MPDGSGSLTADVYRLMTDMQTTLNKVELHLERVDVQQMSHTSTIGDHEARLRVIEATAPTQHAGQVTELSGRVAQLERFRYMLAGGLALISLVFAALGAWAVSALTHH